FDAGVVAVGYQLQQPPAIAVGIDGKEDAGEQHQHQQPDDADQVGGDIGEIREHAVLCGEGFQPLAQDALQVRDADEVAGLSYHAGHFGDEIAKLIADLGAEEEDEGADENGNEQPTDGFGPAATQGREAFRQVGGETEDGGDDDRAEGEDEDEGQVPDEKTANHQRGDEQDLGDPP